MLPFKRLACPAPLEANWLKWTRYYVKRRKKSAATFYWPKHPNAKGKNVNQLIIGDLLDCTQQHCAYCDGFPLFEAEKTIDHFHPKTKFNFQAYRWTNLFPACNSCQREKMEEFDPLFINPEDALYSFDKYFIIDSFTWKLVPSPTASELDQIRADMTIKCFNLNQEAHCKSRRRSFNYYKATTNPVLNEYSYRYII